jgi:hypothetical protein
MAKMQKDSSKAGVLVRGSGGNAAVTALPALIEFAESGQNRC